MRRGKTYTWCLQGKHRSRWPGSRMTGGGNAAALVVALADLVRADEMDATDAEREDVGVVQVALTYV